MRFRLCVPSLLLLCGLLAAVPDPSAGASVPSEWSQPAPDPKPAPKVAPSIEGDASAEYLLTLKVTGLGAGDLLFWDILPDGVATTREVDTDNSIDLAGPPGTYTVKARGTAGGKKFSLAKKVTLTGQPQPIPPPKPKPDPDPPQPGPGPGPAPAPTGKVARFVVAEDTSKAGAWRGDVLGSNKVAQWYKATGLSHRLIDVNASGADPLVAWVKAQAAGKPLPHLWLVGADNRVIKALPCPTDPDAFVACFSLKGEEERQFGCVLDRPLKFAWKTFGSTPTTPIIPRGQWKAVDLSTFLPPVYDQDGRGQCVASSTCTVIESCRAQAGLPYVHLSAGDLYSNINGGRDQGSTLEDALAWVSQHGVCTVASVPYVWNGRRATSAAVVAERKNYVVLEVYLCPTFDAAASALQQGFFLEEALTWRAGYTQPGSDGWLTSHGGRAVGGHALAGYGLEQKGSAWGVRTRNSWNTSFGIAGNCIIPEGDFDNIASNGFFAVRAVVQTPDGKFPTPIGLNRPERADFALAW